MLRGGCCKRCNDKRRNRVRRYKGMSDPVSIDTVKRICFWGGPGSGKSTIAAMVFSQLKIAGVSVELVSEYIKAWAYEKRTLESFDQLYIFAKQQRLEDRVLRAGVNLIITDSPLMMQCVYAKRFDFPAWKELLTIGKMFNGVYPSHNFLLQRVHGEYQQEGRYQTEEAAKIIDREIEEFMTEQDIPFEKIENDATIIGQRVKELKGLL